MISQIRLLCYLLLMQYFEQCRALFLKSLIVKLVETNQSSEGISYSLGDVRLFRALNLFPGNILQVEEFLNVFRL